MCPDRIGVIGPKIGVPVYVYENIIHEDCIFRMAVNFTSDFGRFHFTVKENFGAY